MLLGAISDTHGQLEITERAVRTMASAGVEQAIHCGDVGGGAIVRLFQDIPTHFVAGNCDSTVKLQMAVEAAGQTFHGRAGRLDVGGRKVAFLHGDSSFALQRLLEKDDWDLVVYGHTHAAHTERLGGTLILNPGALVRCEHPSIALVHLPTLEIKPVVLER